MQCSCSTTGVTVFIDMIKIGHEFDDINYLNALF